MSPLYKAGGGGGGGGALKGVQFVSRDAGSLVVNNTAWTDLPVAGAMDLLLPGAVDDIVEVTLNAMGGGEAIHLFLDAWTIVGGVPVNQFGSTQEGTTTWRLWASVNSNVGPPNYKRLVAGDLDGANVRLRLRFKNATAGNKTLYAQADRILVFGAKNLGPAIIGS